METDSSVVKHRTPRWRTFVTIALVATVLAPAIREGDGVPLSSYPMYASVRPSTVAFVVPAGIDVNGKDVRLSTRTTASTSDLLIAESFLNDQIQLGRADALCLEIVARLDNISVRAVEVRFEQHRVIDRARGRPSLVSRQTLATCPAS